MLHELPRIVKLKYKLSWERPKLDFAEQVRKRWIEKWSRPKTSTEMGFSLTSVQQALRKLKRGRVHHLTLATSEHNESFKGME